jgi:hypothetical protein
MDDVRLTEVAQILENYQSQGSIDFIPVDLCEGHPSSMLEYWSTGIALQSKLCYQYRHFLFLTGTCF